MVQNVGEKKSCGKPRKKIKIKGIWYYIFFQLSKNGLFERVVQSDGGGGEEVQESCTLKKCGLKTGFQMDT